ncbi:MAG: hypothetical protein JO256_07730 [Alphaproteobacteria bacterium]|nr:hypothetical protein [Alphaproteobacteria bacterium]
MSQAEFQPAREPLSAGEYAFLICTVLFWAAFVVVLGKDTSWDFRNYHWYGPYALFNHRLAMDVAVAHQASWYNPYLDVPFYWLATHLPSWVALASLGAIQGANVVPLYLMARHSLRVPDIRLWAGSLAILGQAGALTLTEFGTTYYDNVMSVLVFTGLAILVIRRESLGHGPLGKAALLSLLAGFITGCAMGLKLPEMPFCVGFAAALLALGGSAKQIAVRLLAGGIGGVIGAVIFAAPWMLHVYQLTGNPLFPYWNDYWHSPLALNASYRDLRFVPIWRPWWQQLFFPVLFSIDWHVADDLGFQDIRVLIAYFAIIAAALVWAARRRNRDPLADPEAALPLLAFAAASYFVWFRLFAIYRYIVALEMLAPLLIVVAVGLLPGTRRTRLLSLGVLCFAILVTARSDFLEHAPLDDPYIQVALPPIADPAHTMAVMTGDAPMGFIATQLPPAIPVLRIDGWMVQPRDGSLLTRQMKARVAAHLASGGALYLISDATDMARARKATADYGLAIRLTECQQFDTNLVGAYQWCPLARTEEAKSP